MSWSGRSSGMMSSSEATDEEAGESEEPRISAKMSEPTGDEEAGEGEFMEEKH